MDKEFDIEMDEFREQMGEQYRRRREDKKKYRPRLPADFKLEGRYFVFAAIGVLVLIVAIMLFSGGGNGVSREDLSTIGARLDKLENRLAELEGTDRKIDRLESRLDKLDQTVSQLNKSVSARTGESLYHVVSSGESLYLIAQRYGITLNELCRLNGITPKSIIHPGQELLISSGGDR